MPKFILAILIAITMSTGAIAKPAQNYASAIGVPPVIVGVFIGLDDILHNPDNHIKHSPTRAKKPIQAPVQDTLELIRVQVKAVHDADSWKLLFPDGHEEWCRVVGIDAPEVYSPFVLKTQKWGIEAGNVARSQLKGKTIYIDTLPVPSNRDVYGRLLVEGYTDDKLISLSLVENGHAWAVDVPNRKYPNINKILKLAQAEAKRKRLGMYSQSKKPMKPATWRKRYSAK